MDLDHALRCFFEHIVRVFGRANKNRETSEVISKAFVEETMATVGNELVRKQSFLGALEFLNSQATISLVNKKAKSFDAIA